MVGEEPNHTTANRPGPLYIIQYSLLLRLSMQAGGMGGGGRGAKSDDGE